jgi:hypothetical protein
MGMDPEKVINQGGLRRTLLGEEFSDLEFFYARWSPIRGFCLPIKDEVPAIHVRTSRASRDPVKLQLDCHRRQAFRTRCFP